MKKKTRQVKIKTRKLWLWATEDCEVVTDIPPAKDDRFAQGVCRQVFVLPATPEAWDAMVEQGARAHAEETRPVFLESRERRLLESKCRLPQRPRPRSPHQMKASSKLPKCPKGWVCTGPVKGHPNLTGFIRRKSVRPTTKKK